MLGEQTVRPGKNGLQATSRAARGMEPVTGLTAGTKRVKQLSGSAPAGHK